MGMMRLDVVSILGDEFSMMKGRDREGGRGEDISMRYIG
jgi:hypothetical protein